MLAVDMISKLFYLRTEPSLAIKDMNGHGGTFVQRDPNKPAIQVTRAPNSWVDAMAFQHTKDC